MGSKAGKAGGSGVPGKGAAAPAGKKGEKPAGRKHHPAIEDDEDSTDLDEDRKNIREAERALRSLSGEWEGSPPFFTGYDR